MSSFYLFYNANKYLLKNGNTLFALNDAPTTTYIGAYNVNAGVKTTVVNNDTGIQANNIEVVNNVTYESFNEAPYINTEYYDAIHYSDEDLIIQYYVTDYTQEDYFLDKYAKEFLVIVDFGGTIFRRKVKAGNHKINLGRPSGIGETYFSIQCIDLSNNYESAKHYKHLMVVDRNTYPIIEDQTYTMTEQDLTTYSIIPSTDGVKLTDEQGASNILGINNMLTTIREQGYRKIIFYNPNGDTDNRYTYYLQPYNSRDNAIIIPDGLTVDLNSCKWKQLVSYGTVSLLVSFAKDSNDSHIINGYIWGDYDEHIVDTSADNYPGDYAGTDTIEGEGYNLISLNGAFNSLENINHAYGTGYSIIGGGNADKSGTAITNWQNVFINNNGEEKVASNDIWTSDYYELTDEMKQYRYIQANPYKGYSGLCGKANDEIVIYYDENKQFISEEKIRQYGLSLIPNNAKYVRFTLTSDTLDEITKVTYGGFRVNCKNYKPTTCWKINNVNSHNCRTVAYATGIYNHLLLDDCTIENCGQKLNINGEKHGQVTALAIDIEDGYQHSESLYIRNVSCIAGTIGSNTVNLTTTYDVHMYGINNFNFSANKCFGLNLHDITLTGGLSIQRKKHMITGFMMIYNSHIGGLIALCDDGYECPNTLILNCEINGQVNTYGYSNTHKIIFKRCIVTRQSRGNIKVQSERHIDCICNINEIHYMYGSTKYENCILNVNNNSDLRMYSDNITLSFDGCNIYTSLTNTDKYNSISVFNNCKLYNDSYNTETAQIILNNCEIL